MMLTSLTVLDLSNNDITNIDYDSFSSLLSLSTLYLNENMITFLPNGIFRQLSKLQHLLLYGNDIVYIPATAFPPVSTKFNGNSLVMASPNNCSVSSGRLVCSCLHPDSVPSPANDACCVQCGSVICEATSSCYATPISCSSSSPSSSSSCQQMSYVDGSSCVVGSTTGICYNSTCLHVTTTTTTTTTTTAAVQQSSSNSLTLIIAVAVGGVGAVSIIVIIIVICSRRKHHGVVGLDPNPSIEMQSVNGILQSELSRYEVKHNQIILGEEIGRGEFGVVVKGVASGLCGFDFPTRVAVKVMKQGSTPSSIQLFIREGIRIQGLDHDNIVKFLGLCSSKAPFMIILEYMSYGDLKQLLRQCKSKQITLEQQHFVSFSLDVARGLDYLQAQQFVHRDLAARNVLVNAAFTAKIGDFGMSRRTYNNDYYSQHGDTLSQGSLILPLRWMAPESYFDHTWDQNSDLWMFGVLLWEIFTYAELPWKSVEEVDVMRRIQDREKLSYPIGCPSFVYQLMIDCWKLDPTVRIRSWKIVESLEKFIADPVNGMGDLSLLNWPTLDTLDDNATSSINTSALSTINIDSPQLMARFSHLEVARSSVVLGEVLGQGQFGVVHLSTFSRQNSQTQAIQTDNVAVKMLLPNAPEVELRQFEYEAKLLSALEHCNIVRVVGVCFRSQPYMMLLELMSGGSLQSYLKVNAKSLSFAVEELSNACVQLADAMAYLERRKIIHRDLAARNVLVGSSGLRVVKLADVGLSRTLSTSDYYRKTSNNKVPIKWMAPESVLERLYTTASDVWSFGILCWEIYSLGITPYPNFSASEVINAVLVGRQMDCPELCPPEIFDIVKKCWNLQASSRPSFARILAYLEQVTEEQTHL